MKIACTDSNRYKTDNRSWTDELLRHGVSCMEIAMVRLPEKEADQDELITYALARGLSINLHAPYGINNIAASDPERRESSITNVKRTIDLAAKYGLGTVTFHPGRLSDDTDTPEATWERMMDAITEISRYAKERKVFLGLENMELRPFELVYTIDDLNLFAPFAEDNPYFGVTIDFAHYVSHGIGLPDLSALKLPIYDVHISQIENGIMHSAAVDPKGTPDLDGVCRLLADHGYEGLMVLEVRDRIWESVETLGAAVKAVKE